MIIPGSNWVIYIEALLTIVTIDIVDNGDGTQTVTVYRTFTFPDISLVRVGYNDGSWHDTTVGSGNPQSITIPTGDYVYRLSITHGLTTSTYTPLPATDSAWTPFVCSTSGTLEISTEEIDTTVSGSGTWKTMLPTRHGWTLSGEGFVSLNEENKIDFRMLQGYQINRTKLHLRIERTDDVGNVYANEGYGYILNSNDTGAVNGVDTFSLTINGTGELIQTGSNAS